MLPAILATGSPHTSSAPARSGGPPAGWLALFLALAIAWTWPLARHMATRIPHDPGDPLLNIWLLWWNARAVPFTQAWWNPPIFFPMPGALALSEHLAGLAPLTTPVQWLGASPLAAYNTAFILSFALSGFFTFLLVRRLLREGPVAPAVLAALTSGLIYGFGPYRAGQLAHLQVLTSQWMPLALLALHGYVEDGRRRWLALLAAAWLLQALSNGYYLFFFPVLLGAWLVWFVEWRRPPARGWMLAATLGAASAALVPALLTYARVHGTLGMGRTEGEMVRFSATPGALFKASGLLRFWPTVPAATTEEFLFPGVTGVLLVAAGLTAAARRPGRRAIDRALWFYAGGALLMWALAAGPAPGGGRAWLRPYTALAWLPGFDALRVPARFAMLATLCLSIAAGLSFARLAPRRRGALAALAVAAVGGALVDGWMRPMPLVPPPGRADLPAVRGAAVVELPAGDGRVDTAAMYRAMAHGRPLVNGYSGHTPPHYAVLTLALRRGDPGVLIELARERPLIVILDTGRDPGGRLRALVEGLPGIEAAGGSGGGRIYVLPRLPPRRDPPPGEPWPVAARTSARFQVELDLGAVRTVRTIAFPLRWHYAELDPRIRVEGSADGRAWTTVWEDWTGGPALAAVLEHPLEAPVRLTIPDVRMRYVRVYPAAAWLQREVRALGPR